MTETCKTSKFEDDVPTAARLSDSSASSTSDHELPNPSLPLESVPHEIGGECFCEDSGDKKVSFGQVEFHHHPIIMGDHPDCSQGPPFTIDWKCFMTRSMGVDEYESCRGPRRVLDDLKLGWIRRKQVLRMTTEVSDLDMRKAACDAERIRTKREKSFRHSQQRHHPMGFVKSRLRSMLGKSK